MLFIFLGANIDAVETAGQMGISPDRAQDFHADGEGIELNFQVMSKAVTKYREQAAIPEDWKEEIQKDYQNRKF